MTHERCRRASTVIANDQAGLPFSSLADKGFLATVAILTATASARWRRLSKDDGTNVEAVGSSANDTSSLRRDGGRVVHGKICVLIAPPRTESMAAARFEYFRLNDDGAFAE